MSWIFYFYDHACHCLFRQLHAQLTEINIVAPTEDHHFIFYLFFYFFYVNIFILFAIN